jgi:hypothetical protein
MFMQLPDNKVAYLMGDAASFERHVFCPYDSLVCEYLSDLSYDLMHDSGARAFSDVMAFAFFCRRANIMRLKKEFSETRIRLGLGTVFHITPSNVPVNFAFSYVFGLLAGNSNIVKLPPKTFPQAIAIISAMKRVLSAEKYRRIGESSICMQYEPDDTITALFSSLCNARIIWGGDETIKTIRRVSVPVRSIEIAFADRYSFCVMNADEVCRIDDKELRRLSTGFYNDTYVMDQNACSSPHLIIWLGESAESSAASLRFWQSLYEEAVVRYTFQPIVAVDKLAALCENAIDYPFVAGIKRYENLLYVTKLSSLPESVELLRGKSGYFYEYCSSSLDIIASIINKKVQTVTYYGVSREALKSFVDEYRPEGIDRFVPIGSALDISTIWDGYDMVRTLSRIIDIR